VLEREIIEKALALRDGNRSATARYLDNPPHGLLYRLVCSAEGALEA
jgi:DNA-binding NtrC family response regulator